MRLRLEASRLLDIADRLEAGERLSFDEGMRLFEAPDLLAVGWLANRERERRHADQTFFNQNIRIEATNVCVASCLFCAFARLKPGDPGAYTMSLEQAWDKIRDRQDQALTEVHVVNGLHPDLPFSYYIELFLSFSHLQRSNHILPPNNPRESAIQRLLVNCYLSGTTLVWIQSHPCYRCFSFTGTIIVSRSLFQQSLYLPSTSTVVV